MSPPPAAGEKSSAELRGACNPGSPQGPQIPSVQCTTYLAVARAPGNTGNPRQVHFFSYHIWPDLWLVYFLSNEPGLRASTYISTGLWGLDNPEREAGGSAICPDPWRWASHCLLVGVPLPCRSLRPVIGPSPQMGTRTLIGIIQP